MSKLWRYVLMGPPGAGKSRLAHLIQEHFDIAHIPCAESLREHIDKHTGTVQTCLLELLG